MAKGKFGRTMETAAASAAETTTKAAKSPSLQWMAIVTTVALALTEGFLGRYKTDDFETKAKASEAASADAVEANAAAIKALADAMVAVQKEEEERGKNINKVIIQMQNAIRKLDSQTRDIVIRVTVFEKVREARRRAHDRRRMASTTHHPVRREETVGYAVPSTRDTLEKSVVSTKAEPVKLTAPAEVRTHKARAAVEEVQKKSHSRLVPRVWGSDGAPGEKE